MLASDFLVSAVEVADFTTANTYVTSRAVLIGTDVAPQGLANGIEIRTALTTAERQVGQRVFEDLLET